MSQVSSDHPRGSAKIPAPSSERPAASKLSQPGWPEVVVGLVVFAVIAFGGGSQLGQLGLGPVANGLLFALWSGVAGLAGFAAAALPRLRSLGAFGVRRVSRRWLLIGVGGGLLAYLASMLAVGAYIVITGDTADPQAVYDEAGSGGVLSLVLSVVFVAVVTPLGEEFLFRGVVTNALLRYGPFVGVAGSAVIFALAHGGIGINGGINVVVPAAFVVGLITAEFFRRSGSVWPGVLVHVVYNAVGQVMSVLLAGAG